jgi:hypothetical protein
MAAEQKSLTAEQLIEAMQAVAFTPEKLAMLVQELKKPYVDPAAEARELRERQKTRDDYRKMLADKQLRQERCRHKDKSNTWRFHLIHNYPDGKPRGLCRFCDIFVGPGEWDFDFHGKPFQHPRHPLYDIIEDLEKELYMPV